MGAGTNMTASLGLYQATFWPLYDLFHPTPAFTSDDKQLRQPEFMTSHVMISTPTELTPTELTSPHEPWVTDSQDPASDLRPAEDGGCREPQVDCWKQLRQPEFMTSHVMVSTPTELTPTELTSPHEPRVTDSQAGPRGQGDHISLSIS